MSFTVPGRPITFNATSKSSHWPASKEIAQWREDFAWVAKASRKKQTEFPVIVHVRQTYAKGRDKDAVSDFLAHKGGQDGLVDAGVMPDDGPTYVIGVMFWAPREGTENCMTLELEPFHA